jgi:hypothetical protein
MLVSDAAETHTQVTQGDSSHVIGVSVVGYR